MLVVPSVWAEAGAEPELTPEAYPTWELAVRRSGNVNRHAYASQDELVKVLRSWRPDVLDLHEEPFSVATQQWLRASPPDLPVVMYTAQNVDKRYPPPFDRYERRSHRRVAAFYPCTRQAAAVARGKGFSGILDVIPLGLDSTVFHPGEQSLDDEILTLALFGRLVPEKGVLDAVQVLARVNETRPARLVLVGQGPEEAPARRFAAQLGIAERVVVKSWQGADEVAAIYREAHVVLIPSTPTATWTEQFGRVIVEAQASGAVVAGYATGSIPEVGGEASALVGDGAVRELADVVVTLLSEPADFGRRRAQGIELSGRRTWERVAERQSQLYRRVRDGDTRPVELHASPRARRALATREFGPTTKTIAGKRPFALPFLREGGLLARGLGAAIDACAETTAAVRGARGPGRTR